MKNKKSIIRQIIVVAIIIGGIIMFGNLINNTAKVPNQNIKDELISNGISTEKAENIRHIITKCNITNVEISRDDSLDGFEGENSIAYRLKNNNYNAIMYLKGSELICIRWADKDLYRNGEYLNKLDI